MTETKNKTINIRISDTQLDVINRLKKGNPRLNNTDILMSGVYLLNHLNKHKKKGDYSFHELINALLIHNDLLRCLAKPNNPQIDNRKNKDGLYSSLVDNEKTISILLQELLRECEIISVK